MSRHAETLAVTDSTPTQVAAYKGFDKDLRCHGYQFREGETHVHEGAVELCHAGFHGCVLPMDMLSYYPPINGNQYRRVVLDDVAPPGSGDSKRVARKVSLGASINLMGLIKAHVEAIWDAVKPSKQEGVSATTGYSAHSATTGDYAHSATTGRYANSATTGYSAQTRSSVADPTAVAAVLGEGAARGAVGSWLVLTERDRLYNVIEVRAVQVDGEILKADTYYRLVGGQLVEVES